MKKIVGHLRDYFKTTNKIVLFLAMLLTAGAVFVNYHYGLNRAISRLQNPGEFGAWYLVFALVFAAGYGLQAVVQRSMVFHHRKFVLLLLLAPAVFAWKMSARVDFAFSPDVFKDEYWNAVVYWPVKVAVITCMLYLLHRYFDKDQPFYGATFTGFTARPYVIMLLVMVPLVAAASTQRDFLHMYPRLQSVEYLLQPNRGFHRLLYELSYGTDFFSIELFFRGFLVLAFARWAGRDAVLPMAMFYCTIHFGKPLGECISSFFGGMVLGIVSYHTRTVLGGFMVHVGIAWLMELGGYIGNQLL